MNDPNAGPHPFDDDVDDMDDLPPDVVANVRHEIVIVPPEKSEIDILRAERDYYQAVASLYQRCDSYLHVHGWRWPDEEIRRILVLREAAGLL